MYRSPSFVKEVYREPPQSLVVYGKMSHGNKLPRKFIVRFKGILELGSVIEREHEALLSRLWSIWHITDGWGSHVPWSEFHNKDRRVPHFKRSNHSDRVTMWLVLEGVSLWVMNYFLWLEVLQNMWWDIAWYSWLRHVLGDDGKLHGYRDTNWEGSTVEICDFYST